MLLFWSVLAGAKPARPSNRSNIFVTLALLPKESQSHEDNAMAAWHPPVMRFPSAERSKMFPTRHAIERFKQRVVPVTTAEAARQIRAHAANAKVCRRPRRWTPAHAAPGLSFLYPRGLPGVCFLVRDGAVLTVFERAAAREWARQEGVAIDVRRQRPERYHRPSPGSLRWEAA